MQTQNNIPALRFPEFDGEWENKKIGDIAKKVNSGSTPRGGSEVYVTEGILFIRSQNVLDSKLSFENSTYITNEINDSMKNSVVHPNDILLNITGASLGRSCVVPKEFTIGNVNQHVCIIRLNEKNEPAFIQPIFASKKGQNIFTSLQTGSGREGLNFQSIKGISLAFPSKQEQQKIASFLSAVDEKIQQLTRKAALLEQYKKGIMQQLFSGTLRFKDDDGKDFPEWEEKKLGEFCTFFSGGTPTSTNQKYYSGTIPFIGSGNIYDSEVFSFITEEALNNSSAKIIKKGDLLYALYGANSGEVSISKMEGAINQAILCIRNKECIEYLYYVLLSNKDKIVAKFIQGGQGNLSSQIIKRLKYNFPSLKEQQKIASFLSGIDDKIASVNAQLEKTQTFKKGLLQQMFV
ncbi:restriction endonuclease subunit S [Flavobacterium sp.]|jgi:type I restriction enzyme S subunit|uniref:restriction endonuclease subunit S n=1 Tax=Flavobacterium sp. TaxID=239 RepID=UPI002A830E2E|nr:restriction endonuclease subunit S [Flavobacterium sp.]